MTDIKKHSVAILGTGESGMGAALLAKAKGLSVFVSDSGKISKENQGLLNQLQISFEQKGHTLSKLMDFDEIIKSPGIPESAVVIKSLRENQNAIISEIEFAARYTKAKLVAITGSNGKTTTTLLTHHLLESAGLNVGIAGNIGNSLAGLVMESDHDIIVLELSSFQLDGMYEFQADTAILLNITPDHLDRYGYDINNYADSKLRITQNLNEQNALIYNLDDQLVTDKLANKKVPSQKFGFSLQSDPKASAVQSGVNLKFDNESKLSIEIESIPLIGRHNLYNSMAAILTTMRYGLNQKEILAGLKTFENAPHRLEYVARVDGVRFINDSKATNVDSVYYALDGMDRDVIWIAGGVNKGNDYSQIRGLVKEKVSALICLGVDNQHLLEAFEDDVDRIFECQNINTAVKKALKMAYPGDVVLLSPACASFDLFNSYEHRGDLFKKAVLDLKKNFKTKKELVV